MRGEKLGRNARKRKVSGSIELARNFPVIVNTYIWKQFKNVGDDDDDDDEISE